jgi:ATP-dependent exoDNAse (exonuclease V) beta subunit
MMSPLNAATLELVGQHLIEASAGTGKTHNISLLYVRLLLERQFSVRQIAVVTFSDAATRELRSRLRRQLVEAIAHLDGCSASNRPDLDAILGRHRTDVAACARARTVLQAALVGFDEARISTLHSLCRQLLAEHAFETGLPFFELDDSAGKEVTREFVRDFWRRHVILEPDEVVVDVLQRWKTPNDLAAELIRSQTLVLPVERMDPADVEGWLKRGRKTYASARKRWRDLHAKGTAAAALTQLQEAIDFGNLKSAQTSMLAQWRVQKCNAACAGEPDQVDVDALTPLRSNSIEEQISKNAEKAGWTLPAELAEVASVVEAMALADEDVRRALLARFTRAPRSISFVSGLAGIASALQGAMVLMIWSVSCMQVCMGPLGHASCRSHCH